MKNLGISLNGKYGKLKLMRKDESTDEEAMLWEPMEQVDNNSLTRVIGHYNYGEAETIYNAKTLEFILYNIELNKLEKETTIKLEIGDKSINIDKDNLLKEFKDLADKNKKFEFICDDTKLFETPTLVYTECNNCKMIIKLWLEVFGHRRSQIHVRFE